MSQAIKSWSFRSGFTGFSLPVNIFLPTSQIESVASIFANVHYLYDAFNALKSDEKEPSLSKTQRLERFKFIISFVYSGFYHVLNELKLFNPLLGETFQGYFEDGTEVYIEHINHSPPMEAFYICNKRLNFKIYGTLVSGGKRPRNRQMPRLVIATNGLNQGVIKKFGSEVIMLLTGIFTLELHNEKIYFEFPALKNIGMLSDSRKSFPKNQMTVVDPASRLRSVIFFGDLKELDQIEGLITDLPLDLDVQGDVLANKKLPHNKKRSLVQIGFNDIIGGSKKISLKSFKKKYAKSKTAKKSEIPIKGSWISNLLIDSKEFWNPNRNKFACKLVQDPLPSDVRFREDILWLKQGNFQQAQQWKLKIESVMRNERKRREEMSKQALN